MEKANIIDLVVEWGQTQPGLEARLFIPDDEAYDVEKAKIAQFYTAKGYNNYKRIGVWLACCCADPEGFRIWGPDSFGDSGGTPRGPDGTRVSGDKCWWLKPADPEFFTKLNRVLFRFHKKERKP